MKAKKIILAGGTGFLGQAIIKKFAGKTGTEVLVLTRGEERKSGNVNYLHWDGQTLGSWTQALENADVLINLSGKSVDCRYTEKNKKEIISSRVNATRILGEAVSSCRFPPKVWMNSASATIYRAAEDKAMDEFSGEIGEGFSVEVCKAWEQAFEDVTTPSTRKVTLRISMILGKGGGVIPVLRKLVKAGLGGRMGTGRQFISWMHEQDFLAAIEWLIENETAKGVYNLAAPEPIPNAEFMAKMRSVLNRKFGFPAAKWMLEIGAFFIRTETELILKSRRVVPARLLKEGFVFKFPFVDVALKNLLT